MNEQETKQSLETVIKNLNNEIELHEKAIDFFTTFLMTELEGLEKMFYNLAIGCINNNMNAIIGVRDSLKEHNTLPEFGEDYHD